MGNKICPITIICPIKYPVNYFYWVNKCCKNHHVVLTKQCNICYTRYIMQHKDYISTIEAAEILGLSRTQVFRLAKAGKIPAVRIGRNFAIKKSDLGIYGGELSAAEKRNIEESVDRVLKEYGDVIKKLGEE